MGLKEEVLEMKKEVQEIQEHSFAMELLTDQKKQNKRQFIIILVLIGLLALAVSYIVFLLNDIGTTITTEDYDVNQENGDNNNNNFIAG